MANREFQYSSADDIQKQMSILFNSPLPSSLRTVNAMCYVQANIHERIDYVCPTCGEKTLYIYSNQNCFSQSTFANPMKKFFSDDLCDSIRNHMPSLSNVEILDNIFNEMALVSDDKGWPIKEKYKNTSVYVWLKQSFSELVEKKGKSHGQGHKKDNENDETMLCNFWQQIYVIGLSRDYRRLPIPNQYRFIDDFRRLVQRFDTLNITLDESQFCKHCRPDVEYPKMGLVIQYSDKQEPHRVWGITYDCLQLLEAFLKGNLKYGNEWNSELALKSCLPVLEKLLGIQFNGPEEYMELSRCWKKSKEFGFNQLKTEE